MEGKIYKIIDNTNNSVYYGSTKSTLENRLRQHKNAYNSYLKNPNKRKTSSIEIIKNGNYDIILVEIVDNIDEIKDRERFYIENNDCININIPLRTQKERAKIWYNNNKDLTINRAKIWRDNNKDIIKEQQKKYSIDNKEYLKTIKKIWYDKNRELINEKRRMNYKNKKDINKNE